MPRFYDLTLLWRTVNLSSILLMNGYHTAEQFISSQIPYFCDMWRKTSKFFNKINLIIDHKDKIGLVCGKNSNPEGTTPRPMLDKLRY